MAHHISKPILHGPLLIHEPTWIFGGCAQSKWTIFCQYQHCHALPVLGPMQYTWMLANHPIPNIKYISINISPPCLFTIVEWTMLTLSTFCKGAPTLKRGINPAKFMAPGVQHHTMLNNVMHGVMHVNYTGDATWDMDDMCALFAIIICFNLNTIKTHPKWFSDGAPMQYSNNNDATRHIQKNHLHSRHTWFWRPKSLLSFTNHFFLRKWWIYDHCNPH